MYKGEVLRLSSNYHSQKLHMSSNLHYQVHYQFFSWQIPITVIKQQCICLSTLKRKGHMPSIWHKNMEGPSFKGQTFYTIPAFLLSVL